VQNEYTSHNFSLFAICLSKLIKIGQSVDIRQSSDKNIYTIDTADRFTSTVGPTNGRACATVLHLSVCRLSVTLCIVSKRCVLEQKLLLTCVTIARCLFIITPCL